MPCCASTLRIATGGSTLDDGIACFRVRERAAGFLAVLPGDAPPLFLELEIRELWKVMEYVVPEFPPCEFADELIVASASFESPSIYLPQRQHAEAYERGELRRAIDIEPIACAFVRSDVETLEPCAS